MIHAALYEETAAGVWSLDRVMQYTHGIRGRWSLEGFGIERLDVNELFGGRHQGAVALERDLGKRLVVFDTRVSRCVSGLVTNIQKVNSREYKFTATGPLIRLKTHLDTTVYATTTGLDNAISTILTDHVNVASADHTNLDNNTTTTGGWNPKYPEGSYPSEMIPELLEMRGSGGDNWHFYLKDPMLTHALELGKWIPYYFQEPSIPSVKWKVWTDQVAHRISTSLDGIVTDSTVYYNLHTGTATETRSGGQRLVDSTADFVALGVIPGDKVINLTDGSRGNVVDVALHADGSFDAGTLSLSQMTGGTNGYFTNGDSYAVELQNPLSTQTGTVTAEYWSREVADFARGRTSAQASDVASGLLQSGLDKSQTLTLNTPLVQDNYEALWPIHHVFFHGPAFLRLADGQERTSTLRTAANTFINVFYIYAMDWDADKGQIKIEIGSALDRLDVALARAEITSRPGVYVF